MCPADMFAVKRIISTIGLRKIPKISIGTTINLTSAGTPGGDTRWPQ